MCLVRFLFFSPQETNFCWKGCDLVGTFCGAGFRFMWRGSVFSKDSVFRHLFLGDFSHITGKSSSERFELKWHRFFVVCRGCSYHSQNALRYRGMKERDTGF